MCEVVRYPHLLFSGFGLNQQIVAVADKVEIGSLPAFGKAQGVDRVVAVVIYRILSEAFAEDVGIGAVTAFKPVVAGSSDQNIIAIVTI